MTTRTTVQDNLPDSCNGKSLNQIERNAIDHSGSLGSLYDGYRDTIQGRLATNFTSESTELQEFLDCYVIAGRTPKSQNLLQMIKINRTLRLSIYLKMIPTLGIASLIDYPLGIDQHTRFVYFHQKTLRESICNEPTQLLTPSAFGTSTTHVITGINWGIIVVVILQLPPDQVENYTPIFEKICDSLINDQSPIDMATEEENLCNQINSTKVYSNISSLTKLDNLEDIYKKIFRLKTNQSAHQRLSYTLTPVSTFYHQNSSDQNRLYPIGNTTAESLEINLLQQLSEFRVLNLRLNYDLTKPLQEELHKPLEIIRQDFLKIKELYDGKLRKFRDLVIKLRKGISVGDSHAELIELYSETSINHSIQKLITSLDALDSKVDFIKHLRSNGFEYCNVVTLDIKQTYSEQLIDCILRENYPYKPIICLSDDIRHNDDTTCNEKCSEMTKEYKNCVYADFTYSTYKLKKMVIITPTPTENTTHNDHSNNTRRESPSLRSISSSSSNKDFINILLIGESGVGKSTFINAFANYLRFENLKQAEQGKPVVIIPVSFPMTIGDNFEERVIEFGKTNRNENHNEFGESVTQRCKSYVFNISDGKKLRIIDTPGFGDTRGNDQDNLNMNEIFSFLNNIPYLNGICLLFKPEVNQLNLYLRSCFAQLFDCFGKNIRNYLIFCFTNARATFFAPGNTRPLLSSFFESFAVKNITLEKRNTFCFDSESFRYLVATQNSIRFDKIERKEFEESWLRSVTESKRFRDYLLNQSPYRRNNEWQSVNDVQFQINYMIRPILEAMRNLLRNMSLYSLNSSIELRVTPLKRSKIICYACERTQKKYGEFWILPDQLHNTSERCASNEQKSTEYILHYEHLSNRNNEPLTDLKKQLRSLYVICAKFSYFPNKTVQLPQEDPFLTGIERMINEEKFICQMETTANLNAKLTMGLEQLREKYKKELKIIEMDRENIDLCNICCSIKSLNEIPMVQIQLNAIRKYQQDLLNKHEHIVETDIIDECDQHSSF